MVEIHRILTNMISLYSLIMAVWGLFNFIRRNPPDGNYNGALVMAVVLYLIEGIIGVVLVVMGLRPARWIHFLYGVTIMITIPGIFAFTRGRNSSRESMLYGLGFLFIWGLTERATETALVAQ
jgi:heme A synthase